MPERILSEAVKSLDEAVVHIDQLVDEVKELQTSKRRDRILMAGLGLVIVAIGTLTWYAITTAEEQRLTGCRARNEQFQVVQTSFHSMFDYIDERSDDPATQEFVETMRDVVRGSDTVLDCTRDGVVDEDDFPDRS